MRMAGVLCTLFSFHPAAAQTHIPQKAVANTGTPTSSAGPKDAARLFSEGQAALQRAIWMRRGRRFARYWPSIRTPGGRMRTSV